MTLTYTQLPLQRYSEKRGDRQWVEQQFNQPNARFLVVKKQLNLFEKAGQHAAYLARDALGRIELDDLIFLGCDERGPVFSVDAQHLGSGSQQALLSQFQFDDLLDRSPLIAKEEAVLLAYAKIMVHWRATHGFCSACGSKNRWFEAGHLGRCSDDECGNLTFPRTNPAVIMLVTHTFEDGIERCLLGRGKNWPKGVYSCLAGFVDPAESIEDAVRREIQEESGVVVGEIQYMGSQPWPFPSSIMSAFIAKAKQAELQVNTNEIDDARWFSRSELDQFLDYEDDSEGFKKSKVESISRILIDHWHLERECWSESVSA